MIELRGDGAVFDGMVREDVGRAAGVFVLAVDAAAEGEDFLIAEVRAGVEEAGLGVEEVVLQAPEEAESC